MGEYKVFNNKESSTIAVSYRGDLRYFASVECNKFFSLLDGMDGIPQGYETYPMDKKANVARIIVNPEIRNRGIGTELMTRLCEVADQDGVILDLYINPYGDLNYEALEAFYEKFGFVKYNDTEVYYRLPYGVYIEGL